MFGVVPKALWQRECPSRREHNRIRLSCNCLLLKTGGELVLLDAGFGERFSSRERAMYGMDGAHTLRGSLAAAGVAPEAITMVALTHLHFDHFCGCLVAGPSEPSPTLSQRRPRGAARRVGRRLGRPQHHAEQLPARGTAHPRPPSRDALPRRRQRIGPRADGLCHRRPHPCPSGLSPCGWRPHPRLSRRADPHAPLTSGPIGTWPTTCSPIRP